MDTATFVCLFVKYGKGYRNHRFSVWCLGTGRAESAKGIRIMDDRMEKKTETTTVFTYRLWQFNLRIILPVMKSNGWKQHTETTV